MFDDYEDYRLSSESDPGDSSGDGCLKGFLIVVGIIIFLSLF